MAFAYSKALALESTKSDYLSEKWDEKLGTYRHVTSRDLERFARIVAYKVAANIANGLVMDQSANPLDRGH